MWGALVAAPLLWGFPQLLPAAATACANIAYGSLLVIVIVAAPNGIVSRRLVYRAASVLRRPRRHGEGFQAEETSGSSGQTEGEA